jgi:hypothetical protein
MGDFPKSFGSYTLLPFYQFSSTGELYNLEAPHSASNGEELNDRIGSKQSERNDCDANSVRHDDLSVSASVRY